MTTTQTNSEPRIRRPTVAQRAHHAIGPIAAGMILDAADLVTFGPLGIYAGFLVGAIVGFWLTTLYRFSIPVRLLWALVAGVYCTIPFTAPFPVATGIAVMHRFWHCGSG